jgi:hypothetical protein
MTRKRGGPLSFYETRECTKRLHQAGTVHIITRVAAYPQERKVTISTIQKTSENTAVMYRRIGSTTYKVTVHFDEAERETMTDKIVRLIGNDALDKSQECGIIEMPQMSRQPERSAL